MRTVRFPRRPLLFILLAALLSPGLVRSDETKPTPRVKKRPGVQETPKPQTQTAPAAAPQGKPQTQTAPADMGAQTVSGSLVLVQPERHAVVIRTTTNDVQVFVTPQTRLTLDGQASEVKLLQVNDRVESCHFNAKHVATQISVSSAGRPIPPLTPRKP